MTAGRRIIQIVPASGRWFVTYRTAPALEPIAVFALVEITTGDGTPPLTRIVAVTADGRIPELDDGDFTGTTRT